ncbi:MAG: hypothetical protein WEC59_10495 [Salibacteraceae bacterium]
MNPILKHIALDFTALMVVFMFAGFGIVESTFKEYYVYPDDSINQVKITWTTNSGDNVKRYELEKSRDNRTYVAWKKLLVSGPLKDGQKFLEVDFDPYQGWSYYRLRELLADGNSNFSHVVPVFLGIEKLQKGERIVPKSIVDDSKQRVSLFDYDKKMAILVLRDKNGDEYLYDKVIRSNEKGLYIENTDALPPGEYVITASSINELTGLAILVK